MSYCPIHPNREHYTYERNQPKNQAEYPLQPNKEYYTYNNNQPKNQEQIIVSPTQTYGYPYAMFKRRQENNKEGGYSGVF